VYFSVGRALDVTTADTDSRRASGYVLVSLKNRHVTWWKSSRAALALLHTDAKKFPSSHSTHLRCCHWGFPFHVLQLINDQKDEKAKTRFCVLWAHLIRYYATLPLKSSHYGSLPTVRSSVRHVRTSRQMSCEIFTVTRLTCSVIFGKTGQRSRSTRSHNAQTSGDPSDSTHI